MEDDLWWKMTFGGRQPSVVTPPLDSHSTTEPKEELLSAVSTGSRICHCRKMNVALCMHMCPEKKSFLGMKKVKIMTYRIKLNPLLTHTPSHTPLYGIFIPKYCFKYQPSGAGGTRSMPGMPHRLQRRTACKIQNCR